MFTNHTSRKRRNKQMIKMCSINICGLSSRSQMMLDKYSDSEQLDFIMVQETGTVDQDKIKLSNMKAVHDTNKASNRGAVLYVHNSISCTNLPEISTSTKNIDSAWALAVVNKKRYLLGSVYVKLNYNNAIKDTIDLLNKASVMLRTMKACGIILAGDFNARHMVWGDSVTNDYGKSLFDQLNHQLFTIHTSKAPTFICENGSSHIDLMIVSNNISKKINPCYTDELVELFSGAPLRGHVPLLTTIAGQHRKIADVIEEKLNIEATDWGEWEDDLERIVMNDMFNINNTDNPSEIWNYIEEKISEVSSSHCKMKKSTHHSKPYWTPNLTTLCNEMRRARKEYLKRNTDSKKQRMIETKILFDEERKRTCDNFILEKTKSLNAAECLEFWKRFNNLFKVRTEKGVDPLIDDDGQLMTENEDIEEILFSTFFESKHLAIGDFDDVFYDAVNNIYSDIKANNYEMEIQDEVQQKLNEEITMKEIKKAIKSTKCGNKSVDNHNMHPKMLHSLGPNALKILMKLFNCCLYQGEWVWKTAKVIFLKKDGKDTYAVPGSYRPISISSYIGKLLEKILAARLTEFLKARNILDPNQEGFTENRNTVRYLNRLHLETQSDLLENNTVIGLFVDFEKAFDSVWKKGLIVKMSKLHIQGRILKLIDNFLESRKVQLDINGKVGPLQNSNEYGLPQGSALSPVLFKIYLLDILEEYNTSGDTRVYKFADDGTIKIKKESTAQCVASLFSVTNSIHDWTRKWRMIVNCAPNKTEYIVFGTAEKNAKDIPETIRLGEKQIKRVQQTKVLGLLVDEKMSYIPHSKKVNNKLNGSWANMCKYTNKHYGFNQSVITQIAKSYFISSLQYAGHVWQNSKSIKEIESIWYKIIKSAVGATFNIRLSVAEVILGLPPLSVQNNVNQVKHYLKLNIRPAVEDKLRDYLLGCFTEQHPTPSEVNCSMKEIFKFLNWKLQLYQPDFTESDKRIIETQDRNRYFQLSPKACSYTKQIIAKYTESIWYRKIKNEFAMEGIQHPPRPSCKKLPIPKSTTRREEVLLMSLMYPNNLFNDFIYRHTYQVPSPLCQQCQQEEETPYHIILQCSNQANTARRLLCEIMSEEEIAQGDYITILNGSRHENFVKLCLEILSQGDYREHIDIDITV